MRRNARGRGEPHGSFGAVDCQTGLDIILLYEYTRHLGKTVLLFSRGDATVRCVFIDLAHTA